MFLLTNLGRTGYTGRLLDPYLPLNPLSYPSIQNEEEDTGVYFLDS